MTALELMEMFEEVCGARPTNGQRRKIRRTKADIEALKQMIWSVVSADPPMTVRQVFYQLVSRGAIGKTESEYKNVVGRLLCKMRRDGDLPFGWIADNTRWMRKPATHSGLRSMLEQTTRTYRRSLWDDQDAYVEIWLEKDALAGVVVDVTSEWDVPLMVTRGYSSLSYLHGAAEQIMATGKPAYLYYFGDWDPSGVDISRAVEDGIAEMLGGRRASGRCVHGDFMFQRLAVTPSQIKTWELPTRPTKKSDSRARHFVGESVELDAIPPSELRSLVEACIEQHIDRDALAETKRLEALERETLENFLESVEDVS